MVDISKFSDCRILVVGDLMIDEYIWGGVDRISPEAPVPVVTVHHEQFMLGGAGNVINNLTALGAKVSAAGVVGTGLDGTRLLDMCHELGVNTDGIIHDINRPTTRKTRIIAENQHVLRIDRETHQEISKKAFERLNQFFQERIPETDIILVSDYGKGLVTQTLLAKLLTTAGACQKTVIADPKGMDFKKYSGVSLLTPNKKEAGIVSGIRIVDESTLLQAANKIMSSSGIDRLLITCGKDGMVLFEGNNIVHTIRTEAKQVYDVSGAGDTVLAVLGLSLASGASFPEAAILANTAAGIVVGKVGTATVSTSELTAALKTQSNEMALKHKSWSELAPIVTHLQKRGKRIVFTNGCFDLIHAGHIMLFSASKKLGDVLIVAIDDDDSVRKLKGAGRPVIHAQERVRILCALESVDYVLVFSKMDLLKIIEALRPDILTKGSNYTSEEVYGRDTVEKYGGRVVLLPIREDFSSSRIIDMIRNGICDT